MVINGKTMKYICGNKEHPYYGFHDECGENGDGFKNKLANLVEIRVVPTDGTASTDTCQVCIKRTKAYIEYIKQDLRMGGGPR